MRKINIFFGLLFFGTASLLSFGPFNLWSFGLLALFPLFYIIENNGFTIRQNIYLGFFITLAFNIATAHWLFYTIIIFGHIHWTLATVVFFLYTVITSSRYIIFLLLIQLWNYLNQNQQPSLFKNKYLAYTFAWGFSEYFGWQLFHAIGANYAGGDIYLTQVADIFGAYGISLVWFLMNLVIYEVYRAIIAQRGNLPSLSILKNKSLIAALSIITVAHLYGIYALNYWENKNKSFKKLRIGLVQGNSPLSFEDMRSVYQLVTGTLKNLSDETGNIIEESRKEGKDVDLVVWPESSVPFLSYLPDSLYRQKVTELIDKYHVPLIINDIFEDIKGLRKIYYNNLWVIGSDARPVDYYHKIQLLPFGEFIPLGEKIPFLYNLVPEISGFTPGHEEKTIALNGINILPSICYELLPAQFTFDFFQKSGSKAQIIINMTNDSWFGPTVENAQHIMASSLRAIELRLPIIRATNSGISAYIENTGRLIDPTGSNVSATRVYDVPVPDKSHSIFSVIGIIPFELFISAGILLWGFAYYRNISSKKTKKTTAESP